MKRVAIILSFGFNIAVGAGLLYGTYFSRVRASAGPELGPVFQRANLKPAQRVAMRDVSVRALDAIVRDQARMRERWAEGIALLAAPQLDWEKVRAKQAEINDAQRQYQSQFFTLWMDRARLLEADQREQVFRAVQAQIKTGAFFQWKAPVRTREQ